MKIHPWLSDPHAVLISHVPVSDPVQWEDYRTAAHRAMVAMQIELEGEKAVIKPNLTAAEGFADPDTGITTHPTFVQGMVEYLQAHGVRRGGTYILEDPRNHNDNEPRHWHETGYRELAERTGAKLRCPTTYTCTRRTVPHPLAHNVLNVSRLAVSPNTVLFNVPKLKTHNLSITTLCIKNLMGIVNVFDRHFCSQALQEIPTETRGDRGQQKEWMDRAMHERWQTGLARRLADTSQVVRSHINIVEGVVGREGTGFQHGRNHPLGLVVAGINVVAVDTVASYLMGFDPQQLITLRVASEAGLGSNDLGQLRFYTLREGGLVPCGDIEALRARPPLRVISNIIGEEEWHP